jgi:hypothetical protein
VIWLIPTLLSSDPDVSLWKCLVHNWANYCVKYQPPNHLWSTLLSSIVCYQPLFSLLSYHPEPPSLSSGFISEILPDQLFSHLCKELQVIGIRCPLCYNLSFPCSTEVQMNIHASCRSTRHGAKVEWQLSFLFFHWLCSPEWALACWTVSFHFFPICH